nr:MAG TPA: hypothetical protein [Caudoviricetes sp.]
MAENCLLLRLGTHINMNLIKRIHSLTLNSAVRKLSYRQWLIG